MPIVSISGTRRVSTRWLVFTAIAMLLHVVLIEWATGNMRLPTLRTQRHAVVAAQVRLIAPPAEPTPTALLLPLPAPVIAPAPLAPAKTAAAKKAVPPPEPSAPPILTDAIEPGPAAPPQAAEPDQFAGLEVPGTSVETVTPVETAAAPVFSATPTHAPRVTADALAQANPAVTANPAPQKTEAPAAAKPVVTYKMAPPPSAVLEYDVEALRSGQTIHGNGKIGWHSEGGQFTVNGKAGVLFVNFLNFKSEGMIDQYGVSPVLYSEKPFAKSETNTHFHRERNTISFSASSATYARSGGEQDRASVIWQMAAIGRGDSTQIFPGAQIDLMVAGVREAEIWHLRVIGLEDIKLGTGPASAWHIVRSPRPGSYDKTIDLWLAPQQEWYPVRLRFTETNGNYIDMALSAIHPGPQR